MNASDRKHPAAKWDAVRIATDDQVAVAARDLVGSVTVLSGEDLTQHFLPKLVPMGHKFALSDLPAGTRIRKYGHVIGVLTRAVAAGEHVHVHNLASLRTR